MFKKIISLSLVIAMALNANALNILSDLNSTAWGSSYHKKSHTITYNESWGACGWWADGADYSAFETLDVEIESSTLILDLVVEYAAEGTQPSTCTFAPGATHLAVALDPEGRGAVKSMYIKCHELTENPKVTVLSASLTPKALDSAVTIFENNFNLG
ncbi:MAG: hypothetical protein HUK03_05215, partial [Bacteroidaceae bacterium]|nr:hypothetical protein [Bacteroidaceae bacterium]